MAVTSGPMYMIAPSRFYSISINNLVSVVVLALVVVVVVVVVVVEVVVVVK
jgi:hypothetical protein